MELGAALRLGQVYRTWRSQVDMEAFFFIPAREELRAAIAHLEARRADAASAATSGDALDAATRENGVSVDPAVAPNEKARIHYRDPGLITACFTPAY